MNSETIDREEWLSLLWMIADIRIALLASDDDDPDEDESGHDG